VKHREGRDTLAESQESRKGSQRGVPLTVKDFDAQTKEKAARRTRILLLDGHCSHYTPVLLEYAHTNKIVILGYPPHCTHVLQGLDVFCFAKMKTEFRHEIQTFENLHLANVMKASFAGVFGHAFLRAFTPDTVKAAFAATGVYPFNPNAIKEKQMAPSLPTSTKGTFPLPQPSPVRAIIAAMGAQPPMAFDLSPTTWDPLQGHHVPFPQLHPQLPGDVLVSQRLTQVLMKHHQNVFVDCTVPWCPPRQDLHWSQKHGSPLHIP
jgi:hypothetical protein